MDIFLEIFLPYGYHAFRLYVPAQYYLEVNFSNGVDLKQYVVTFLCYDNDYSRPWLADEVSEKGASIMASATPGDTLRGQNPHVPEIYGL